MTSLLSCILKEPHVANEITMESLRLLAKNVYRVPTNPASYIQGELDFPLTGEFTD